MDLRQLVSPITHSQLPALNQSIGIPTRNISSPPKGDETVAGADWPVRGATLAAIGRVSRAGCVDWASGDSDAARSEQEGYSRLGMLSDWCYGVAPGHLRAATHGMDLTQGGCVWDELLLFHGSLAADSDNTSEIIML